MIAAEKIGYPIVLKLHSETITHKTEVGGVLLNLQTPESVSQGFNQIKASVAEKARPQDFLGVTVQKMIKLDGYEIILGSTLDPQFGPVVLFGTGGQLVEVYQDKALALPPLNATLANKLMRETKIYKALQGVRGRGSVDFAKLEKILIAFSELITSHPNIQECDINPLLVSDTDLIALDARIVLSKEPIAKAVIRPYPSEYISNYKLKNGTDVLFRPVRPEDEPLIVAFHKELSEESVKARYFEKMPFEERTSHERMIRICHSDYDREILLIALENNTVLGAARLSKIPLTKSADFKLIIIDRAHKQGLGTNLLKAIVEIAKKEKIETIQVTLLSNNEAMKKILSREGFALTQNEKNPTITNASLKIHS